MENKTLITPVGIASYPHLTNPDSYQGQLNYKCDLVLDASDEAVAAFRSELEGFIAKAKEEATQELTELLGGLDPNAKNPKVKKKYEETKSLLDSLESDYRSPLSEEWGDDDELTGNLILKTKSRASFKAKQRDGSMKEISLEPKIYDATPKLMQVRPDIRGGSKLALEIIVGSYCAGGSIGAGVFARIKSVQVISLSGGDTGSTGFGSHSGGFNGEGYVAPETPAVSPAPEADQSIDY